MGPPSAPVAPNHLSLSFTRPRVILVLGDRNATDFNVVGHYVALIICPVDTRRGSCRPVLLLRQVVTSIRIAIPVLDRMAHGHFVVGFIIVVLLPLTWVSQKNYCEFKNVIVSTAGSTAIASKNVKHNAASEALHRRPTIRLRIELNGVA